MGPYPLQSYRASCLEGVLLLAIAAITAKILWRLLQVFDPVLRMLLDMLNELGVAHARGS